MNHKELLERRRSSRMEMEKALQAAKHPRDSKFGECLLNVNTKEDPVLTSKLNKIRSEMKRMNIKINQLKGNFVRKSPVLNYEPMILVERSPYREKSRSIESETSSEDYKEPDSYMKQLRSQSRTPKMKESENPSYMRQLRSQSRTPTMPATELEKPSYMRQLRSRCVTPVNLRTIDAFTLRVRKKTNVWDECDADASRTFRFSSTVRPYSKLTEEETDDLQHGWNNHKPRVIPETRPVVSRPKMK